MYSNEIKVKFIERKSAIYFCIILRKTDIFWGKFSQFLIIKFCYQIIFIFTGEYYFRMFDQALENWWFLFADRIFAFNLWMNILKYLHEKLKTSHGKES